MRLVSVRRRHASEQPGFSPALGESQESTAAHAFSALSELMKRKSILRIFGGDYYVKRDDLEVFEAQRLQ